MSNEENKQAMPWPPFVKLDAYCMPEWLRKSVDEMAGKYPDKITRFFVDLYSRYYYDDNNSYDLTGEAGIVWEDYKTRPSEDELDHVPSMRRMERLSDEMWEYLPVDSSEEGGIVGELEYVITREGLNFSYNELDCGGDCVFRAHAKWDGSEWTYEEVVEIHDFAISETSRIVNDTAEILGQINPDQFNLSEWPPFERVTLEFNEEDELIISVKGGGLFEKYERKVA